MEAEVQIQVLLVSRIIQSQRAVTCCGSPKQPKWKLLKHELSVLALTKLYNTHSFHSKMKIEPYMRCFLSTEQYFTEYVHNFSNGMQKQIFSSFFDGSLITWKYAAQVCI